MSADLSQVVYAIGRTAPEGVALLGTCFAVAPNRVATAFHVAGADDQNVVLVVPKMKSLADYQDTSNTSLNLVKLTLIAADPIRDLAIFEGHDIKIAFPYALGGTDLVATGAPIVTLGFPHANVGRHVLTQQEAHVGARILIENSGQKSKHIVLNTQAREGQSGGPVLDQTMSQVVAVLLGSFAPGERAQNELNGLGASYSQSLPRWAAPAADRQFARSVACASFIPKPGRPSCDEYPFNSTYQNGYFDPTYYKKGAVTLQANQSAGGILGGFYRRERVQDDDSFIVQVIHG